MILAFSGKKQSGKSTAGNFVVSVYMANMSMAKTIKINDQGQIEVSDLLDNKCYKGIFDLSNIDTSDFVLNKIKAMLEPQVKLYSFADLLKKEVCIKILGLDYNQCYGTDAEKNSLTNIKWADMPGYEEIRNSDNNLISNELMSARQVMEFVGTNIFRRIKNNVWVDATINQIKKDKPKLAVITDCRFPNEVLAIKNAGGKVVRLTRSPFESTHESENILNANRFDWNNFDYIINNSDMSIYEQCIEIEKILCEII